MRRSLSVTLATILIVAIAALGATVASGKSPKLGLDLQGGASVVLAPAPGAKVNNGTLNQSINIIRQRVDGLGVAEANVARQGNDIIVELPGVKNADQALSIVGQTAQLEFRHVENTFSAGGSLTDIPGYAAPGPAPATTTTAPSTTTTTPTTTAPSTTTGGALPLRGTSPPSVRTAGLPDLVPAQVPSAPAPATPGAPTPGAPAPSGSGTPATAPAASAPPPFTPKSQVKPDQPAVLPEVKPTTNEVLGGYVLGPSELSGSEVSDAFATAPQGLGGGWTVDVRFKSVAPFDNLAKKYYQQQVAIVLDDLVISAPTINAQSFNGQATISGGGAGFTESQARSLANVLRYGALPVQLQQQAVQKVSATLGKDSLRAGLIAGLIGLILVLLYMIAYYRALGVVVVIGLAVSGALMYSIVTFLGSKGLALSLSGATGIIVSVGVTVDSYIVYFERLKDEIRSGKTVRSSVDRSFGRAWRTIVSADAVSFIGAALLYLLTVGPVRGFAFFLGLSTLLDLLVAYCFTRPMVVALGRNRTFTQARFFGVARGLGSLAGGA